MAIMNADKTTSQLSIMPDPALKQMAMMHKGDPYMLSLIIAEDGRRKEMRTAAAARMAGMPQGNVADQAISQMGQAPQQQMPPQGMPQQQMPPQGAPQAGIQALPAPNVQGMAGGGIVALAEGGMPDDGMMTDEQLIGSSEPVIRMAGGGDAEDDPNYDPTEVSIDSGSDTGGTAYDPFKQATKLGSSDAKIDAENKAFLKQQREAAKAEEEQAAKEYAAFKGSKSEFLAKRSKDKKSVAIPDEEVAPVAPVAPVAAVPKVNPVVAAAVKERVTDKAAPLPVMKAPSAAKAAPTPVGGVDKLMAAFTPRSAAQMGEEARANTEAANKETEAFYKPEREKLQQQQEAIANRKDSNIGNALMRAGLGMMAGKSQYAMQNIGEGGIQGLNAYQESQKADAAAQQANQHSQMLMVQAERSERAGNLRQATMLSNQARQEQQYAQQFGLQAKHYADQAEQGKVTGQAQMMQARAAQQRASAIGGDKEDKLDLARQRAAAQDPEYKALAAQLGIFAANSPKALAARARMQEIIKNYMPSDTIPQAQAPSSSAGGGVNPTALAAALAQYK